MILSNKTVMITGVGAGLGRECALAAYREGANVVLAARSADALAAAADEVDPSGDRVAHMPTDITDADGCAALVSTAVERFGRLDAVVQVAAYENAWGGLQDTDFDRWRKAFDTNVIGALTLLRPAAAAMQASGGGSIVLVGSQSMLKPQLPQAGYAASKGALLSAMYYLADELGPDNIRVNMVVPSWMWGPPVEMLVGWRSDNEQRSRDEVLDDIVGKFPLRRMTEDGEVANAAVFFASDLASAITGQYLLVNSGEMSK